MNFESMPNNQPQPPNDDGIELSPEELAGHPGDKVPGLQTQEALEGVTGSAMEEMQKFSNWEREIEEMNPADVPAFIKKLGQEMKSDPMLKNYPELRLNYLQVREAALKRAGVKALELLTRPGEKPIDSILEEMKTAKTKESKRAKAYIYTKADSELNAIIAAYELQIADPKILKAEKIKIETNLSEAKELKQTVAQLKEQTVH